MKTKDIEKAIADNTPLARKPKKYDGAVVVYLRGVHDVGDGLYGAAKVRFGDGNWLQHGSRSYRPADICTASDAETVIDTERERRRAKGCAHTHHVTLATQLQAAGINAEGSERGVVLRGTVKELTALVDAIIASKVAR